MKKILFLLSILVINFCACSNIQDTVQSNASNGSLQSKVNELYNKFLDGEISIEGVGDINDITIPTGDPNIRFRTGYAYQDSNGDGIEELHINSGRYYTIISYKDNELFLWKSLIPYPYYLGLKDGAFMSYDARQSFTYYNYFVLNYSGDTIFAVSFSKNEKERYEISDKIDEYTFDGVTVSKEVWEGLTERYLYIDDEGVERVRNEIEWTILFEGDE